MDYLVKIKTVFERPYIKVFFKDPSLIAIVKECLENSSSIKKINITHGKDGDNLTVYPTMLSSPNEIKAEIDSTLKELFNNPKKFNVSQNLIETSQLLPKGSKSKKLYCDAINKIMNGQYTRNAFDDLRLSCELYLKEILGNNKPIEKQQSELSKYLKSKGV